MRHSLPIATLLLLTPAVCQAAESTLDRDQAKLYSIKLVEILSPVSLAIFVAFEFLLAFLAAVLSARICFGGDRVWGRTIKWYIYSFLCAIGLGIMVVVLALVAQQTGLLIGSLLAVVLAVVMVFGVPMHVFEAGFLRVLAFLVVLLIVNAIASVLAGFATPLLFGAEKGEQIRVLTEDLENRRIRAEKDYTKVAGSSKVEEDTLAPTPAPVSRPMTLREEAAALNARFAVLKERFAKLDKTNAAEVAQYNVDYKKYTDDLNAYNARAKADPPAPR